MDLATAMSPTVVTLTLSFFGLRHVGFLELEVTIFGGEGAVPRCQPKVSKPVILSLNKIQTAINK